MRGQKGRGGSAVIDIICVASLQPFQHFPFLFPNSKNGSISQPLWAGACDCVYARGRVGSSVDALRFMIHFDGCPHLRQM